METSGSFQSTGLSRAQIDTDKYKNFPLKLMLRHEAKD